MTLEPLLISFESASSLLGISRALLYTMHSDGRLGPMPHKLGRRSLLNRKELERWTDEGMPPRTQWLKAQRGTLNE
ncbi:MAG: helix-turn-helix domain-containing protein [Sedimentisphaerales bacterium]